MDYFSTDQIIMPEKGDLLISEPYLPDPNFERTVVLLCEHDKDGSFGFVLNKRTNSNLADLIEEVQGFEAPIHLGGPVQQNTLHFLHKSTVSLEGDKLISDDVFWGVDFDKLLYMINTHQISLEDVRFFIGYSGWSSGQLMEELESKSWIVFKQPSSSMIFETPPELLWKESLQNMGGKFRIISNYPTDPRLN